MCNVYKWLVMSGQVDFMCSFIAISQFFQAFCACGHLECLCRRFALGIPQLYQTVRAPREHVATVGHQMSTSEVCADLCPIQYALTLTTAHFLSQARYQKNLTSSCSVLQLSVSPVSSHSARRFPHFGDTSSLLSEKTHQENFSCF